MHYLFRELYRDYISNQYAFTSERICWLSYTGYKIHTLKKDAQKLWKKPNRLLAYQHIEEYLLKTLTIMGDFIGTLRR